MIHCGYMVAKRDKTTPPTLTEAIEKARVDYLSSLQAKHRLPRQFMNGVVHGFGIAIGSTIVFGLVVYLASRFLIIPEAQQWLESINPEASLDTRR